MKTFLTITGVLATAVIVLIFCFSGNAAAQYASPAKPPVVITALEVQRWLHENWAGDPEPYLQIEHQVDQAMTSGENPAALLQHNKALAQQQPQDPQAQFRWGYSGWKMMNSSSGYREKHLYLGGVFEALASAPSPDTYEYARLRYLVAPHSKHMVKIGERLLQVNQNDSVVKSHLVGDYIQLIGAIDLRPESLNPQLKLRAVTLAQQVIESNPTIARYHASLGSVYATAWVISRSRKDALQAVKAYQEYLRFASPNDEARPQVLAIMKDLAKT